MNTLEVRIEKLAPARVARFHASGLCPEAEAWAKLRDWAGPRGLLKDAAAHPVFGFNNPSPSRPGEDYGYEFWIRIGTETEIESGFESQDFPGGWYAVTTVRGFPNPDIWMQLFDWVRNSPHRPRRTHELERPHDPLAPESDVAFDLYLPIEGPTSNTEFNNQNKMRIRGTDFVMYQVSDLARAAKFYRETLGLPQEMYSEEYQWAEFNCGNVTLSLHGGVQLPEMVAGARIALAVDDVFAASAALKAQGVRFATEPTDYSVCQAAAILDPDGNTVMLHKRADGSFGPSSGNTVNQSSSK